MSRARKTPAAPPPPPPPPDDPAPAVVARLRTSKNVRAELARLYRGFRAGTVNAETARVGGYLLQTLASVIRDENELEKLAAIEAQIAELQRGVSR